MASPMQVTRLRVEEGAPRQGKALRVLVVGADGRMQGMRQALRQLDAVVQAVAGVDDAQAQLALGRVDAILLDPFLPDGTGLEAYERVQRSAPATPVVLVTDRADDAIALDAVRQGAQDHLVRDQVSSALLERTLRYAIERHRTLARLDELSHVDFQTGLYNRRGFHALGEGHLKAARRTGRQLAALCADLDHLKEINDTLGHAAGDRAIIQAAEVLAACFRQSDVVARLGGDEFGVLALDVGLQAEEALRARIAEETAQRRIDAGGTVPLAMSIGVAVFDPALDRSLDDLLRRADEALYRDKRARKRSPSAAPRAAAPGPSATAWAAAPLHPFPL